MSQRIVLPLPPVVASISPFFNVPVGTYAVNGDRGLRRICASSGSSGISTRRLPSGTFSLPAAGRNRLFAFGANFGIIVVSTTLFFGMYLMAAKYSAACLVSSGVNAAAITGISHAFALFLSEVWRRPFLKSAIWFVKY